MPEIIPTIFTNDIREVEEKLLKLEGLVKSVQIDIVDGQFVATKTIDPSALENIDTNLKLDFHLMTKEPIDWVERAVRGGAERIIGQIEKMNDQLDFIRKLVEVGCGIGLALDINTPISQLDKEVLIDCDVILIMGYQAGLSNQVFNKVSLDKIKKLDELRKKENLNYKICVDGGVNETNISEIIKSGADEVAIGRRLFEGDVSYNIRKIQTTI
jgi:ribulose-phosphate 3-epimerase